MKSRVLESGAAMIQDFTLVKQICAHLNAFHVYANDPTRCVEADHYCTHLTEGTYVTAFMFGAEKNYRISHELNINTSSRYPPMLDL